MKRIIAIMFAVTVLFTSCGGREQTAEAYTQTTEPSVAQTAEEFVDTAKFPQSLSVEPSTCETVFELPAENAMIEGGPVGEIPRFYVYEDGLTYYVNEIGSPDDITLRKYSKCVLDVPSGYTDAKIVDISSGGGSGEVFITVNAMRDGTQTYIEYYFYCDNVTTPVSVCEIEYLPEM